MKRKQGISLIVLVITIIVMIILAAAVVITLSNTGIINKANTAVAKTNKKQIEQLATLAWADAYSEGARTQEELEDAVDEALKDIDTSDYDVIVTEKGVTVTETGNKTETPEEPDEPEGPVTHSGTIPKGATYYVGVTSTTPGNYEGATATYTEGQEFPATVQNGDVYVYGDYEYKYNYYNGFGTYWFIDEEKLTNGWGVRVRDNSKAEYEEIITDINSKVVNCLMSTFFGCKNMIEPPEISKDIVKIEWIFAECSSLTTTPVFENHITDLSNVFRNCSSLNTYEGSKEEIGSFINYPIPENVTGMSYTFQGCTGMKKTPNLANATKLENMSGTFYDCSNLEVISNFPNNLKTLDITFSGCTSLESSPAIPYGVTSMSGTFMDCTALTTAPAIPSTVEKVNQLFQRCSNLTGNVVINSTPTNYDLIFLDTVKPIKITGNCSTEVKRLIANLYTNVTY